MDLEGVQRWVEDSFGYMNGVSDNDDFGNVIVIWGLVDTTSNDKKFSFNAGDVNCMVDSLGNRSIVSMCIQYRYSNVIDASICDYNGSSRGTWWLNDHVVKLMSMRFIVFLLVV